ncbi:MAG: DHA2 family efflux MFS transporter permease subunit [Neisseriaceae bacterium]|nr:DHA2 family efflux MFS transporter permease subunit [Neisseriaceae bacterium]
MNHPPLQGARLAWVTLALTLAVFLQIMGTTIANVALPSIAGDLGAASSQSIWVITSFAVATAISVALTGWLAKRIGQVRLFVLSTLLFGLTSWLCGLAPNLELLIALRVLQGLVAGPIIPLTQSLLMASFAPQKRNLALALWSMMAIVAPVAGPIVGGLISDYWSWPWIFYLNLPLSLFCAGLGWRLLRQRETPISATPINTVGLILLTLCVGALQTFLDRGKDLDWFASTEIVILAVTAVVTLVYLIIWESSSKDPVVELSLFRDRNFSVGVIALSLAFMVYLGNIVLLPMVLQAQLGYTATWAGLAVAPIGLFPLLLSPLIGHFSHKFEMRTLATLSFVIFAIGYVWRSHFTVEVSYWTLFWPQLLQGIGLSMFFLPLTAITLSSIPPEKIASAASLSSVLRILFGGIGTSLAGTLWERRTVFHHARLSEHLSPFRPEVEAWQAQLTQLGLNPAQQLAYMERMLTQQSAILGAEELFWLSGVCFLLLISIVWLAKPLRPQSKA